MKRGVISLLALASLAATCTATAGEENIRLVDGTGRDSTSSHCTICHSLDYIPMNAPVMDRTAWEKTVQKMISRFGAPIDQAAEHEILEYLSTNYTASVPPRH